MRRRQGHPTPVLLPGKSHRQRSLVGCSPWDREESDMTERLHFHFSLSCIVEGNGNPLQCSCLENPKDGEAWWASISGVAQSRTQLKRLGSSSSSSSTVLGTWKLSVSNFLMNVNTDVRRAENCPSPQPQALKLLQVESSDPVLLTIHKAET